jgi:Fe(3+) dicitrate transport protein
MTLKDFSFYITLLLFYTFSFGQHTLSGKILNADDKQPIGYVEIYNHTLDRLIQADANGEFSFKGMQSGSYTLEFLSDDFEITTITTVVENSDKSVEVFMQPLEIELSAVVIEKRREQVFGLSRLRDIEGTAIYAGKKTEVVILSKQMGNMAINSPRQVFSRVVGLNIYESNEGGLQLNVGGRGLDPNRSSHFNIRQNEYDISADILGYPESYYTPPAEGLDQIQVIRGAASLQYGTQFGGLINFIMKKPVADKKIALVTRNTVGSFGLLTNFTSLSGTLGKFSYYTYFNYKQGDGFQANSRFESYNYFGNFNYQFSDKTSLSLDYTYFDYLAQQPGGLTDKMFVQDPLQSNRTRNWFDVNWNLLSVKLKHKLGNNTDASLTLFGLKATRKAVGFRTNRVFQNDEPGTVRDLITGEFSNWGFEARVLHRYNFFGNENAFVIGTKYYDANNTAQQGPGSSGSRPDFAMATNEFPSYQNQSDYTYPNKNIAFFSENIFRISPKLSITPGIRFEHINTRAEGFYRRINLDNAGNVILDETKFEDNDLKRSFVLLGVGISYKPFTGLEFYSNLSQNYRSVTFNDIRIAEPSYVVDENLKDEKGYTFDAGLRGKVSDILTYDVSAFGLAYNGRLGQILQVTDDFRVVRYRTNVGDAFLYGAELFGDVSLQKLLFNSENENYGWNTFLNLAVTKSEYTKSKISGIEGNEVEFVPLANLKAGMSFEYKKFISSLQFTYITDQYTDATNAKIDRNENVRGIEGQIPAYHILDLSFSYPFTKNLKLETGINNLTGHKYFTRRATGYPGPGIIPSAPRTFYATLQFSI